MQRQKFPFPSTNKGSPAWVERNERVSRSGSPPRSRIFSRKNAVTPAMFSMMSRGEGNT